MKKFGFDLIVEQAAEGVAARVSAMGAWWQFAEHVGDTPIERLLLLALHCWCLFSENEWDWDVRFADTDNALERMKNLAEHRNILIVQKQVQLENWRVDFLIHAYADWARRPKDGIEGWRSLIVECDGHDFHERTKEQAARDRARDRAVQIAGLEVFRFTGSEIWRDPWGCAAVVIQWANRGV